MCCYAEYVAAQNVWPTANGRSPHIPRNGTFHEVNHILRSSEFKYENY